MRDLDKPSESEQADQVRRSVWRRESDIRSELEDARHDLTIANDHLHDVEKRCENLELQALQTETKYRDAVRQLRERERALEASSHQAHLIGTAATNSVASSAPQSDNEDAQTHSNAVSPPGSPKQLAANGVHAVDVPLSESLLSKKPNISPIEYDHELKEKDAGALREALVSRILEGRFLCMVFKLSVATNLTWLYFDRIRG